VAVSTICWVFNRRASIISDRKLTKLRPISTIMPTSETPRISKILARKRQLSMNMESPES